jgi:hypothetical protein
MLQLIEKILFEACESHNELSAIDAFKKLRHKVGIRHDMTLDESILIFDRLCCYAIHTLYNCIGIETTNKIDITEIQQNMCKMLIDILFISDRLSTIKKYVSININNIQERVSRYRKIMKRAAYNDNYVFFEPPWLSKLVLSDIYSDQTQITPSEPHKTTSVISKYVEGKQLVTIKTVIEQEISMYIDVNVACPKFIKIYMPHLEEPIFISRVIKKYVKFAKLFDGKSKENTLSYYYKLNKNESSLEFIDEEMEKEVADLLGVNILEKEIIDEDIAMEEAAKKNKLSDEQVTEFKKQLDEVRWSIKNAV